MASNEMFDVHIVVPARMVGTIVELLNGEGLLISVSQQKSDETNPVKTKYVYTGGKRKKRVTGQLLATWCVHKNLSKNETEKIFKKYQHARSSSGFCQAKKQGYIQNGTVTELGKKALSMIVDSCDNLPSPQ